MSGERTKEPMSRERAIELVKVVQQEYAEGAVLSRKVAGGVHAAYPGERERQAAVAASDEATAEALQLLLDEHRQLSEFHDRIRGLITPEKDSFDITNGVIEAVQDFGDAALNPQEGGKPSE